MILAYSSHCQTNKSFKIKGDAVKNDVVAKDGNLENSKIKIENTSGRAIYIEWTTIENTFPEEWDCSMCQHGACQIGIPEGSEFKKLNSNEDGFIAIHVMPHEVSGSGVVKFKVYNKKKPEDFEIITFNLTVEE